MSIYIDFFKHIIFVVSKKYIFFALEFFISLNIVISNKSWMYENKKQSSNILIDIYFTKN